MYLLVNALLLLIGASLIAPKLIQVDQIQEKAFGEIESTDESPVIEQKRKPDPSKMTKDKFLEIRRQQAINESRIPKPIVSDRLTWTVTGICLVLVAAYFIAAMLAR